MNIQEFVTQNAKAKPNADIQERWAGRVETAGMHLRGASGADAYIGQYGKGMKAAKAIMFARMAEVKGFPLMARRFWEHAFFFQTGTNAKLDGAVTEGNAVDLPPLGLRESFGQRPELPTAIKSYSEALRLAEDPRYGVEDKVDGHHLMSRVKDGVATGGNKKGLITPLPLSISDALIAIGHDVELDGENIVGVYHVYDLLSLDGVDYRLSSTEVRHAALEKLLSGMNIPNLVLVKLAKTKEAKLALIAKLKAARKEGFVLKLLAAPYVPGENGMIKYQFRALNTFIVGEQNGDKSSVSLFVVRKDGTRRDMGNLTIPGLDPVIPQPESIAEVEYLYVHHGVDGKLAQPQFKGERNDALPEDCREDKLKVKADVEE